MEKLIKQKVLVGQLSVHATSPYNDGWTQEFYRKEYEKQKKKLERAERQLAGRDAGK